MKVFWSWQSDTHQPSGRYFVRSALEAVVGHERIVLVMNQAEGASLKTLPFDLRHWRGPVAYNVSKTADESHRELALATLTEDLAARLVPSLAFAAANRPPPVSAQGVPADAEDPAVWAGARPEIRVQSTHLGDVTLPIIAGPKVYARIIPAAAFEATRADMSAHHGDGYPLESPGQYADMWNGKTESGATAWNWIHDEKVLRALTHWFQSTGEIWAIWPDAIVDFQGSLTFTDGFVAKGLERFLSHHSQTLTRFGAARPWRVILGAHGLKGSVLPRARYARGGFAALSDEVRSELRVNEPKDIAPSELVFAFMSKVHDAYGAPNLDPVTYKRLLTSDD
jgi:hypothetical protein